MTEWVSCTQFSMYHNGKEIVSLMLFSFRCVWHRLA